MDARLVKLLGCSALWALCACGGKPNEVELRLYPCALISGSPMSVALEIRSLDAEGAEVGALLAKTFAIGDQAVFDDNFATVGFKPPAGALTADIKVTWNSGDEQVSATYVVAVPGLGDSVELGSDECEGESGTTTTTATSMATSEPSTSSSGSATTEATTGTTTDTDTTTGTTTATTSSTSSSTTEPTSTSTTDPTDTTTTSSTTDTSETDTDTTTGDPPGPMEGGPCVSEGLVTCNAGPGQLGPLLFCVDQMWVTTDPDPNDDLGCDVAACDELGFTTPQVIGCVGSGGTWACACADSPIGGCGGPSGCDGPVVELCISSSYYAATCGACALEGGEPVCKYR